MNYVAPALLNEPDNRPSIGNARSGGGQIVMARTKAASGIKPIAVDVRNVSIEYSGVRAVDDVSFDLATGDFLTILGPSGSGKTTLLRTIAGFQSSGTGDIFIAGKPVRSVPPHKRSIGMVFQRLALFPHLTAAANVAFPLRMRRFDARTIPERVERYLDLVKLSGYGHRRINELSGGQQQRVAIARALVFEPTLLLLDEPLAALDRKLREEMQLEFRRIQRELGVTTINVTHDQREALIMSDEIIVMDGGRIQQKAQPVAAYREPANRFVAGFIGVTNFLAGTMQRGNGDVATIKVGASQLTARLAARQKPAFGGAVIAALRAEQIRVSGEAAALRDMETSLPGVIEDVVFEGERVVYEVRVADLDNTVLRVFDHDPAAHAQFEPQTRAFLGWNARDLLVFSH
jgi:putative spermidine/putrescine transport system ATP-binding protein